MTSRNSSRLARGISKLLALNVRSASKELASLQAELKKWKGIQKFPPGHFHSPVHDLADLGDLGEGNVRSAADSLEGIALNMSQQAELFATLSTFYGDCPFPAEKESARNLRYFFENGFFSYSDGIILYCLLRYLKPRRYVEVGSGYSSCLVLDVNDAQPENRADCTFIEPYPDRLLDNIKVQDRSSVVLIQKKVQDVDLEVFEQLGSGDILFVDSSHVSKFSSDVNFLLFQVLPVLKSGVWVHFHDIFYPFEYPSEWLRRGWSWNEAYLLRAFLTCNSEFEIRMWGDALAALNPGLVRSLMPNCLLNTGASIWLQRK